MNAYVEKKDKDSIKANLKVLKKTDKKLALHTHAQKVKQEHIKKLNKKLEPEEKLQSQETVFTDEDFDKFERMNNIWLNVNN